MINLGSSSEEPLAHSPPHPTPHMPSEAFPPDLGVADHLLPADGGGLGAILGPEVERPMVGYGLNPAAGPDAPACGEMAD